MFVIHQFNTNTWSDEPLKGNCAHRVASSSTVTGIKEIKFSYFILQSGAYCKLLPHVILYTVY